MLSNTSRDLKYAEDEGGMEARVGAGDPEEGHEGGIPGITHQSQLLGYARSPAWWEVTQAGGRELTAEGRISGSKCTNRSQESTGQLATSENQTPYLQSHCCVLAPCPVLPSSESWLCTALEKLVFRSEVLSVKWETSDCCGMKRDLICKNLEQLVT